MPDKIAVPDGERLPARPTRSSLIPDTFLPAARRLLLSPGMAADRFVFLSGHVGAARDGTFSEDVRVQARNAFDGVAETLAEDGLGWGDVVEMTTYHVGLRQHFNVFCEERSAYVREPFPSWTAVGVAELLSEQALVEIAVVALRSDVEQ